MTTEPTKSSLRNVVRKRLREHPPTEDGTLRGHLAILLDQLAPHTCVGYLAFQQEPTLNPLLEDWLGQKKTLLLPRFDQLTRQYDLVAVTDLTSQLVVGHYGIREPISQLIAEKELELNTAWLVPGLAFTANGLRLGRGAGYYDRLFQHFPQGRRIGIAWEMQLLQKIPAEPWDTPMDYIVTESRIIDCRRTPFT